MQRKQPTSIPSKTATKTLESFSQQNIPYVIVGAAALVFHGIPRSTIDVDIIVPSRTEIIHKLFQAANKIGLTSPQKKIESLAAKPELLTGQWITFEDRMGRQLIDTFFETIEQFKKLYRNSVKRKHGKTFLRIASLSDIEKMKKESGRPIDLADLAIIREFKNIRKQDSPNHRH